MFADPDTGGLGEVLVAVAQRMHVFDPATGEDLTLTSDRSSHEQGPAEVPA
jgi:hypothetical protein